MREKLSGKKISPIYSIGAVTTESIWPFARLNRATKHFEQGLDSCQVLEALEPLIGILVQC